VTDHQLQLKAITLRRAMLQLIFTAGAGHTGGGLSCMDILNVLYHRVLHVSPKTFRDPHRDRYIQSKGHCVEALYCVLADCGFFPASNLETVGRYRSPYVGHPTRHIPGIEMNTGALGHGTGRKDE
jgi:transketolase